MTETCSALNIEGGAAPGVYKDQGTPNDGKPTYAATVGGEVYILVFAEDTTRRKLTLDGAEGETVVVHRSVHGIHGLAGVPLFLSLVLRHGWQ